jgi:nitrogen regulatory protein PII
MKEVKAIIQPFMLDKVVDALEDIPGVPGFTVSEVRVFGVGAQGDERVRDVKKLKIEIMVPATLASEVVNRLAEAAHTGNPGDGGVFVIDISESVSILTGHHL